MIRRYQTITLLNTLKQDIFNDDILYLKDVKIPNFFKIQDKNLQFEFCHQILELYEDYIFFDEFKYENKENSFIINKGDIVFDCGANMGLFAAYAATKGAIVYCFEPCSYTFNLLKETQKLYPNQIYIYNYGLGKEIKDTTLLLTENLGANHLKEYFYVNNDILNIGEEQVKIITLDYFIQKNNIIPNIIKIDTEGAELDILKGSTFIITNFSPKITSAIYHNINDKFKIISYFKNYFSEYTFNEKNSEIFLTKE